MFKKKIKIMNSENELLIEICKKCYLDCKFCSSNADKNSLSFIDLNTIKTIIRDANRLKISKIQISGGEPFTHPNLLRICEWLSKNNKKIYIYTCGNINLEGDLHQIPYETLKYLKELRVETLRFNLQSHKPEIHNFLTNSNSFKNAILSLKNSIDLGFNTEIHIIPLKQNYIELSESIKFFRNLGISKVKFLRFVPHGRGSINKFFLDLNQTQYEDVIKKLIYLKKKYRDFIEIGSSFNNSLISNKFKFCRDCQLGKSKIAITPEGKVFPCVSTKNLKLFNFQLHQQSLYNILNSNEYVNKLNYYLSIPFRIVENDKDPNKFDNLCPTQRYLKIKSLN